MTRWGKKLRQIGALSMAIVLAGTSADFSVLAAESTDIQYEQAIGSDYEEKEKDNETEVIDSADNSTESEVTAESDEETETTETVETMETIESTETEETKETIKSTETEEIIESTDETLEFEEATETDESIEKAIETSEIDLVEEDITVDSERVDSSVITGDYSCDTCEIHWEFNNGTLTISGTGEMPHFNTSNPCPWTNETTILEEDIIEVNIEGKVTYTGKYSFDNYTNLKVVNMPNVTSVGNYSFKGCSSLETVSMPNVTNLSDWAFAKCSSLETVSIPKLESVGENVFYSCSNLNSVEMLKIEKIGTNMFKECKALKNINAPNVTYLNEGAFRASGIEQINLPYVTTIDQYAFASCQKLKKAEFKSVTNVGTHSFNYCINMEDVYFPKLESIGVYAFGYCNSLTEIDFPLVTDLGNGAFNQCKGLTKVELPMAKILGHRAISQCDSLISIYLPSVTTMDTSAFFNNKYLTNIYIPNATTIGSGTFNGCDSLETITLGCCFKNEIETDDFYGKDLSGDKADKTFYHISYDSEKATVEKVNDYTIKYKCCSECAGVNIVLDVPENTNYTGDAIEAVCQLEYDNPEDEVEGDFKSLDLPDIEYSYKGGSAIEGVPVNVGTYIATLTIGSESISVEYKIEKPAPKADMFEFIAPENLVYDGNTKSATVVVKDNVTGVGNVTVKYYKDDSMVSPEAVTDAGTYIVKIDVAEGNEYAAMELASNDWTFTISKAVVPVEPVANTLFYTGEEQELVSLSESLPSGCTIKYSTDGENWSTSIPTSINAGDYIVYYKIEGRNYFTKTGSVDAKINKLSLPENIITANTLAYTGRFQELVSLNDNLPNGCTVKYSMDGEIWSSDIPIAINAGEYTVYYKVQKNNYNTKTDLVNVIINKIDFSDNLVTANVLSYTGRVQELVSEVLPNGCTLKYSTDGENWSAEIPTAINAGVYTLYYKAEGSNYNTKEGSVEAIINKAELSGDFVTANTLTYTGESQKLVSVSNVLPNGCTLKYSTDGENWSAEIPTAINAGNYTVYYKAEGNNYNTKEGSVEAVVNKADLSGDFVTVNTLVYTGESQELVSVSNQLPNNCTVKYSTDNKATWSEEIPKATNAGEYTVHYKVEGNNYNTKEASVKVTINKAVHEAYEVRKEYSCASDNSDSVSLHELLPADCGTASYGTPVTAGNIAFVAAPSVTDEVLSYTLEKGSANTEGTIITAVDTKNYETFTITVYIKLTGQNPVKIKEGTEISLNENVLTYGESLSKLTFKPAVFTDTEGNEVQGTLVWKEPELKPAMGTTGAVWVFIPEDETVYERMEGTVAISVDKAKASVTIEEGKKIYKKLILDDDFALEGITFSGDGTLTYTVGEAKGLNGEMAAPESIITISENGMVSVQGAGSAVIYVSTTETENYYQAEPQAVLVEVEYGNVFYIEGVKEFVYTGIAIKPALTVYDGLNGSLLIDKKDYTVSFKNNTKVYILKEGDEGFDAKKAPQAIIKGKGRYASKITVYFTILPKDISQNEGIVIKDILLEEKENVQKSVPAITYNGKKLAGVLKPENGTLPAKTKDFIYSYTDISEGAYTNAGTWKILVEGTGNYTGSRYVDIIIAAKGGKMSSAKIAKIAEQSYSGVPVELSKETLVVTAKINGVKTTLEQGVHYSVSYKNNNAVGTATVNVTGIPENGFSGSKSATFKIVGTLITKATVTGIEDKYYNGSAQTQDVTVTLAGSSEPLLKENYTITYENNINTGTAKAIITGVGTYSGTIVKTFKINPYDMTGETNAAGAVKENSPLTEANGLFAMKDGELSVKFVKGGAMPLVKLIFNGNVLTEGKDYKVAYKNNKNVYALKEGEESYNAKKAPVLTITGKGNFKGSISKTFVITTRTLQEENVAVSMTVSDKAVSTKKGGYISKPVLTDSDGKVLKQGRDYTAPVYTMTDENGQTVTLSTTDTVVKVGTIITVTVKGIGAYNGDMQDSSVMSASYRITEKNFTSAKIAKITKPYTGSAITLTKEDFYTKNNYGEIVSKVTIGKGKNAVQLHYGTDFEIVEGTYKKNIEKGTASVTIRGIGAYGGSKTIKFKIGTREIDDWFWWMDLLMAK